jgi:molybdate transport system substrate-binding protein
MTLFPTKPRLFLAMLALWAFSSLFASAQIPAQPADPNQPIPAIPVQPPPAVPPLPAAPTTNAATATAPAAPSGPSVSIIADSSLKAVLQELAQTWADSLDSSPQVPITLTNAGTMRAKIEAGATWDVAIGADVDDMKEMTDKGLLLEANQQSLARNTLVLLGRTPLVKNDDLDWFDLVGTEWKKVALGNPDLVTSGRLARRALQRHDLVNDDTKSVFAYAPTEKAALALAERQQADAVFLYKTDAAGASLPGFDLFPLKTEDAPPVFYTAAIFHLAQNPALARAFITYCASEPARAIWTKYGFETN